MNKFKAKIIEADSTFFDGELTSLIVPVFDGQYGVQAGHSNVVIAVVPGEVKYTTTDGDEHFAAVSDGMIRIENGDVTILVDSAEHPEEIDEVRAREKEAAAREAMLQKKSMREYLLAESSLRRAVSRLKVKGHM